MAVIALLTNAPGPSADILPSLGLLSHKIRVMPAQGAALLTTEGAEVVLVDGRKDLAASRTLCQLLRSTGIACPLLLVLTEGGMAAISASWQVDDVILDTAGPAEVEARHLERLFRQSNPRPTRAPGRRDQRTLRRMKGMT